MTSRFSGWLLTFWFLCYPQVSVSADFDLGGDQEMGCFATLSGVIVRGDAVRVAGSLNKSDFHQKGPICLDSPGGLWAEGLALMELFYELAIPTAVPAGARCESACAIAFLGGSTRSLNVIPFRARFLHVEGQLGFHAPYLEVPPGQYDETTVLAAFGRAMEVVTGLTAWSERLALPDAFLVRLFGTGPKEMDMIDTVGEAAELSVQLVGHVLPTDLTEPMISEACQQASPFLEQEADRYDSGGRITNVFRIEPNQNGIRRGVGVLEYSVESWTGWFVCVVGYNWSGRSVTAPAWGELSRFEGARDLMYVEFSDDPIQEWDDPMRMPPAPPHSAIMAAAVPLSEILSDQSAVRVETIMPAGTQIQYMRTSDWIRDAPATIKPSDLQSASLNPGGIIQAYSSFWDHNGSRMGLVAKGNRRQFYYVVPRAALAERGVTPATLLFDGERLGHRYEGEARIFAAPPCGVFTYAVTGSVASDQRSVTMRGLAPRIGNRCEVTGYREDTLVFTLE